MQQVLNSRVSSDPVDAFRKTDAAVRIPRNHETAKPRNQETRNHETHEAYAPYRICEICAISRKTIDYNRRSGCGHGDIGRSAKPAEMEQASSVVSMCLCDKSLKNNLDRAPRIMYNT